MSRDMHTIRFMLEEIKALAACHRYDDARDMLVEMRQYYSEADLEHISLEMASSFLYEAEQILETVDKPTHKKSLWNRFFGTQEKRNAKVIER